MQPHTHNTAPTPKPPADPKEVTVVEQLLLDKQAPDAAFTQLVNRMRQNQPTFYAAEEYVAVLGADPVTQGSDEHEKLRYALDPPLWALLNHGRNEQQRTDLFALPDYLDRGAAPEATVVTELDTLTTYLATLGSGINALRRQIPNAHYSGNQEIAARQRADVAAQLQTQEAGAHQILDRINTILGTHPDYSSFVAYKINSIMDKLAQSDDALLRAHEKAAGAGRTYAEATAWDTFQRSTGADAGSTAKPEALPTTVSNRNAAAAQADHQTALDRRENARDHAKTALDGRAYLSDLLTNGHLSLDLGASRNEMDNLGQTMQMLSHQFDQARLNRDPDIASHERFQNKIDLFKFTQQLGSKVYALHERSPRRRDLTPLLNSALALNRRIACEEARDRINAGTVGKDGRIYVVEMMDGGILINDGSDMVVYPNGDMAEMTLAGPEPRQSHRGPQPVGPPAPHMEEAPTVHPRWDKTPPYDVTPLPAGPPNKYHQRGGVLQRVAVTLGAGAATGAAFEAIDWDGFDWKPFVLGGLVSAVIAVAQVRGHKKARRREAQVPLHRRYQNST